MADIQVVAVRLLPYNQTAMEYQVLVESQGQRRFVASVIGVPDCRGEGETEEEAVEGVKIALTTRLSHGKVVTIDVETPGQHENPLLKHAGRFREDPTFDSFLAEIEKYRRELDSENHTE